MRGGVDVDAIGLSDDGVEEEQLAGLDGGEIPIAGAVGPTRRPPAAGAPGAATAGGWRRGRRCRGTRQWRTARRQHERAAAGRAGGIVGRGAAAGAARREQRRAIGRAAPPSSSSASGTSLRRCISRTSAISSWKRGWSECRTSNSARVKRIEGAQQILARDTAPPIAVSRGRSDSPATSGSFSRAGSTDTSSRSRVARASSRHRIRRS